MPLTLRQKSICERILNVFETGSPDGDYAALSIFHDGPHGIRQITYGRSQTTEYGNLQDLVSRYASAGGKFSEQFKPFVPLVGHTPLVDHAGFKSLLRQAGDDDPVMQAVQDQFFDDRYFAPALKWAEDFGFQEALSILVIYDSFIHSGRILPFLRSRFPEVPPANGGNERTWISQYVGVRQDWLANHSNPELHPTVYRTKCFKREIARENWDLSQVPINANGTPVSPKLGVQNIVATVPPPPPLIVEPVDFLGDAAAGTSPTLPGTSPSTVSTAVLASNFAAKATSLAIEQWIFFGEQRYDLAGTITHSGHKEGENGWWQRVGVYWTNIGRDDLDGRDHEWPWSAAFISWIMRQAGAGARFTYSASHATYISKSIRDRIQGNANASYWGFRLAERKPQVGDLVCWDRDPDKLVDYDHQHGGDYKSHTDLVVAVGSDEIEVIGGNIGNSVTRRSLALDADGFLVAGAQGGETLFALMACRLG